jgi:hypothetical protein
LRASDVVDRYQAAGKAIDRFVAGNRAVHFGKHQLPAVEALGPESADDAVQTIALLSTAGRNCCGDKDKSDILGALQLVEHRLAGGAHAHAMSEHLQVVRQRTRRCFHIAVAGALEAGDEADALQDVFFLTLNPADVADAMVRAGRERQTAHEKKNRG